MIWNSENLWDIYWYLLFGFSLFNQESRGKHHKCPRAKDTLFTTSTTWGATFGLGMPGQEIGRKYVKIKHLLSEHKWSNSYTNTILKCCTSSPQKFMKIPVFIRKSWIFNWSCKVQHVVGSCQDTGPLTTGGDVGDPWPHVLHKVVSDWNTIMVDFPEVIVFSLFFTWFIWGKMMSDLFYCKLLPVDTSNATFKFGA